MKEKSGVFACHYPVLDERQLRVADPDGQQRYGHRPRPEQSQDVTDDFFSARRELRVRPARTLSPPGANSEFALLKKARKKCPRFFEGRGQTVRALTNGVLSDFQCSADTHLEGNEQVILLVGLRPQNLLPSGRKNFERSDHKTSS